MNSAGEAMEVAIKCNYEAMQDAGVDTKRGHCGIMGVNGGEEPNFEPNAQLDFLEAAINNLFEAYLMAAPVERQKNRATYWSTTISRLGNENGK